MKNYFDVAGKYAVVTGASSGLGRQFALCLAEQGCNVAIAARRVERLEEVKKEVEAYGVKCLVLPCDVTDTEQIRNSVDKVVKEFGRIDILINNAAASFATPVVETTDDQWYNVMKTNVDGVFFFAREVGKVMIAQNYGKIINIGSLGSYIGLEESSVYCSTRCSVPAVRLWPGSLSGAHAIRSSSGSALHCCTASVTLRQSCANACTLS